MFELPHLQSQRRHLLGAGSALALGGLLPAGAAAPGRLAQQIQCVLWCRLHQGQLRKSWRAPRPPNCPDPGSKRFVDNKPGAAGNIAMSEVARAEDQHTLILGHIGTGGQSLHLRQAALRCQQGTSNL